MGFFESIFVKVVTMLAEKLANLLYEKAKEAYDHSEDQKELNEKADKVKESAQKIKDAIREGRVVTEEMAEELKKRNRRLRDGGIG